MNEEQLSQEYPTLILLISWSLVSMAISSGNNFFRDVISVRYLKYFSNPLANSYDLVQVYVFFYKNIEILLHHSLGINYYYIKNTSQFLVIRYLFHQK